MIRRAATLIVAVLTLGGCARMQPASTPAIAPDVSGGATQPAAAVGEIRSCDSPNPGPFKSVEIKNSDGSVLEAIQARGEVGKFGGSYKVATFGSGFKTFNSWDAGDVESKGIGQLQFESLVTPDPWTGEYVPRLAKSFTISPDKRTFTFVLRKGLKWSDGVPITADDVVYTFNTIVKEGFGQDGVSERDTISVNHQFPKIEKVDNLTVRFTTQVPFGPFLSAVSYPIAPKHVLEPVTNKGHDGFPGFWDINCDPKSLVASGPFILDRHTPGQRAELKRNPNYFMVDKQGRRLPYLDRFILGIVPDLNALLLKFYGGELDMMDIRSIRGSDVATMKQRQARGDYYMYNLGPDDGTYFIVFNLCRRKDPKSDTGKFYVDPIKSAWFNNVNFRQAVSHTVDRERIIANTLKGVGVSLYAPESQASIFFDKEMKPFKQDLDLARDLLKKGGFVLKGDELFDAKGNRVEFSLNTNAGNPVRDAICVSIQNELKKLGIKVNYQPVDWNVLLDKTENSLDWDAVVMALSGSKLEPYEGANVWKSDGRLHMFDQRLPDSKGVVHVTDARDWEKQIDSLFDKFATTLGTERRRPYVNQYQQVVYDQCPFIYIYSPLDITAIRKTVGNYMPKPIGVFYTPKGSMHNIEEIYFKNAQSK